MNHTAVGDVMTTPMLTLERDTPVGKAAAAMREAGINSVVVVGDGCQPAGIFTATDALAVVANEGDATAAVSAYMSSPVETVGVETPVAEALEQMAEVSSHLPVVDDDGDGLGILSKTDLVEAVSGEQISNTPA